MTEIYKFTWQHFEITIEYTASFSEAYRKQYGVSLSHLEITSPNPLPISSTGYRSCFITSDQLAEWKDPVEFVKAWMEQEAQSEGWKEIDAKTRQFNLF